MNRRTLLGLLGAAPIAGPAALKSAMAGAGAGAAIGGNVGYNTIYGPPVEAVGPSPWSIIGPMRDRREVSQYVSQGHVPPHIGTKRSWSVAFKAHVEMQERAEMLAWERKLEAMDKAGLLRIAQMMGVRV